MKRKSAFTLIELLVVIAIIAILAAILFPVFAQAREKARQTMCANNEKQLALAMIQYVQDYDEEYPGYVAWGGPGGNWQASLLPYVKSTQVWYCPDYPPPYTSYLMNGFLGCGTAWTSPGAAPTNGVVSPGNTLCSGADYEYETPPGLTLSKVALPTVTWLFWEGYVWGGSCASGAVCFDVLNHPSSPQSYCSGASAVGGPFDICWSGDNNNAFQNLHHGENIAYTDGHVKFMTQPQLRALGTTTEFAGAINSVQQAAPWHSNGVSDQEPYQ